MSPWIRFIPFAVASWLVSSANASTPVAATRPAAISHDQAEHFARNGPVKCGSADLDV